MRIRKSKSNINVSDYVSVSTKFSSFKGQKLIDFADNVHDKMTSQTVYNAAAEKLTALKNLIAAYIEALKMLGEDLEINERLRDKARVELIWKLVNLSNLVNYTAESDVSVMQKAGFAPVEPKRQREGFDTAITLEANSKYKSPGVVEFRVSKIVGAIAYEFQKKMEGAADYLPINTVTTVEFEQGGFEQGAKFECRARAIGRRDRKGEWSKPVTVFVS